MLDNLMNKELIEIIQYKGNEEEFKKYDNILNNII